MKRLLFLIAALCACAPAVYSQGNVRDPHSGPIRSKGAPTGACEEWWLDVDVLSGTLYTCDVGTWTAVGSSSISGLSSDGTTLTFAGSGGFSGAPSAGTAGIVTLLGNTAPPTVPLNSAGFIGPNSASFTSYGLQLPATNPATATPLLSCGTPSTGVSTCSWVAGASGGLVQVPTTTAQNTILPTGSVVSLTVKASTATGFDTQQWYNNSNVETMWIDTNGNLNLPPFTLIPATNVFGFNAGSASPSLTANVLGLLDIGTGAVGSQNGFIKSAQSFAVTGADVTCGTGGTIPSCTTFQTITGLSVALPLSAVNWTFDCNLIVGQSTAAAADQIGVQTATNASTNLAASGTAYTAAAVSTSASITGVSSTTAQSVVTFTPGATGTKMPVRIFGTIEGASASGTTFNLVALTGAGADLLTIYRGSSCRVY